MIIKLKRLHPDAKIPTYGSRGAACLDLYAVEDITFRPGASRYVRSGWAMEIPAGCYVEIKPRSGLATKSDIIIPNSPCTIDSDYRGEIITCMKCIRDASDPFWRFYIKKGDRYAQMMLKEYIYTQFEEVDKLSNTERGNGGFGSTGK
jgi:dUTP pyrophosphatase